MCFYPVCIILRPAAALSAAARARLGPGADSGCSAFAAGLADPTTGLGSRAWAEAEFINNPRPPLWGGGAFLAEDAPPPLVSARCAPPVPLRGPPRGGSERGEGGALGSLAALLCLTSARGESPDAAEAKLLRLGRWATVRTRPQPDAGSRTGPGPARDPVCTSHPEFSFYLYRAQISCFSFFFFLNF